jgi:hypothetical protein
MGNMALEVTDGNVHARALVHRNFENWAARVASWFDGDSRLPPSVDRSRLARFVLTVMEGGLMQSRAAGTLAPFDESVAVLRDYFERLGVRPSARAARTPSGNPRKQKRRTR